MRAKHIISIFLGLCLLTYSAFADVEVTKSHLAGEGYSDEEIEYLEEALRINPDNFGIYYGLGVAYYRRGDYDKVIECYKKCIPHLQSPNYYEAARRLELAYAKIKPRKNYRQALGSISSFYQKDLNKEIEDLARALKINPKIADIYIYLVGLSSQGQYNHNQEIEYLEEALRINPDNFGTYFGLGIAYYLNGDTEQALDCLLKFTQLNPDCYLTHYGLGIAYYNQGDIAAAVGKVRRLRSLGQGDLAADLEQVIGIAQDKEERINTVRQAIAQLRTLGWDDLADDLEEINY